MKQNKKYFTIYLCTYYLLFVVFNTKSSSDFVQKFLLKNPKVVEICNKSNSFIAILETQDKNYFLVKQKKNWKSTGLSALWMVLSAKTASSIGNILSQKVYIVDKDLAFPGKKYQDQIVILMSQVPGIEVKESEKYRSKHIRQRRGRGVFVGVVRKIIKNMSAHVDLARIVALDCFIGYVDRQRRNFFYDEKIDRFWIIDMDTPRENLCGVTCTNFQNMLEDESISFSKNEINALYDFARTLKLLIDKNPPKKTIKRMMKIAKRIGIQERKGYRLLFLPRLLEYADLIEKSYEDAKKLLCITKKLIRAKKIKMIFNG